NQKFGTEHQSDALPLGDSLYLTLGDYSQDLADATNPPPPAGGGNEPRWPHHAVCLPFEKTPGGHLTPREPLPDHWLGYDGIDLVVLLTEKADLLTRLNENEKELHALTEWVRRGGRLVVSVSLRNLPEVRKLLESGAWRPLLPTVLPRGSRTSTIPTLSALV